MPAKRSSNALPKGQTTLSKEKLIAAIHEERVDAITIEPLIPGHFIEVLSPDQELKLFYNTATLIRIAQEKGRFMQPPHFREEMDPALVRKISELEGKMYCFDPHMLQGARSDSTTNDVVFLGSRRGGRDQAPSDLDEAAILRALDGSDDVHNTGEVRHGWRLVDQVLELFYPELSRAELYVCPVCYFHFFQNTFGMIAKRIKAKYIRRLARDAQSSLALGPAACTDNQLLRVALLADWMRRYPRIKTEQSSSAAAAAAPVPSKKSRGKGQASSKTQAESAGPQQGLDALFSDPPPDFDPRRVPRNTAVELLRALQPNEIDRIVFASPLSVEDVQLVDPMEVISRLRRHKELRYVVFSKAVHFKEHLRNHHGSLPYPAVEYSVRNYIRKYISFRQKLYSEDRLYGYTLQRYWNTDARFNVMRYNRMHGYLTQQMSRVDCGASGTSDTEVVVIGDEDEEVVSVPPTRVGGHVPSPHLSHAHAASARSGPSTMLLDDDMDDPQDHVEACVGAAAASSHRPILSALCGIVDEDGSPPPPLPVQPTNTRRGLSSAERDNEAGTEEDFEAISSNGSKRSHSPYRLPTTQSNTVASMTSHRRPILPSSSSSWSHRTVTSKCAFHITESPYYITVDEEPKRGGRQVEEEEDDDELFHTTRTNARPSTQKSRTKKQAPSGAAKKEQISEKKKHHKNDWGRVKFVPDGALDEDEVMDDVGYGILGASRLPNKGGSDSDSEPPMLVAEEEQEGDGGDREDASSESLAWGDTDDDEESNAEDEERSSSRGRKKKGTAASSSSRKSTTKQGPTKHHRAEGRDARHQATRNNSKPVQYRYEQPVRTLSLTASGKLQLGPPTRTSSGKSLQGARANPTRVPSNFGRGQEEDQRRGTKKTTSTSESGTSSSSSDSSSSDDSSTSSSSSSTSPSNHHHHHHSSASASSSVEGEDAGCIDDDEEVPYDARKQSVYQLLHLGRRTQEGDGNKTSKNSLVGLATEGIRKESRGGEGLSGKNAAEGPKSRTRSRACGTTDLSDRVEEDEQEVEPVPGSGRPPPPIHEFVWGRRLAPKPMSALDHTTPAERDFLRRVDRATECRRMNLKTEREEDGQDGRSESSDSGSTESETSSSSSSSSSTSSTKETNAVSSVQKAAAVARRRRAEYLQAPNTNKSSGTRPPTTPFGGVVVMPPQISVALKVPPKASGGLKSAPPPQKRGAVKQPPSNRTAKTVAARSQASTNHPVSKASAHSHGMLLDDDDDGEHTPSKAPAPKFLDD